MKPLRTLLLYARYPENATLAYQQAWPRHFVAHPRFDCDSVNVLDVHDTRRLRLRSLLRRARYDVVVILHSVFSNGRYLRPPLLDVVRRIKAVKAYFIGNEYMGMPEKMWFCETLAIDLLVSQFANEAPLRLYRERLGCVVVSVPIAGVDPSLFAPRVPTDERPIDLGYRAYANTPDLGHREREELAEQFNRAARRHGLRIDISLDPRARFGEREWADFLNRCKGQIGSEAGGDYFELTSETRDRVFEYREKHPDATFEDLFERFFRRYDNPVPGRALAGRVIDAAATGTVQLLLEGEYGGYFEPDVHYIPLRKDFGNLDEAVEKFRDPETRRRLADNAYEVALSELTYEKLIDRFHAALAPLV